MYFKKMTRKDDRLSPDMPIRANRTRGKVVRHSTMIRAVRLKGRNRNTGSPVTAARMPASITFLARNMPPKNVPVSTKFGGMI